MAFEYARTAEAALRMLQRFGVGVSIARNTPGAYDPEQGAASITSTSWTATAVRGEPYSAREIDGTLIQAGDLRLYVSAGHDLQPGDVVTLESEAWRVERPNPIRPASTTLLYAAQVRK